MNPLYHDPGDNHPNETGADVVAEPFVWETFDAAINYELGGASTFQLTVNITDSWNMVSIPGLHPVDQNVNTWWQYRDLSANVFKYLSGYQAVTDAAPGLGYWKKHTEARTYNTEKMASRWNTESCTQSTHRTIRMEHDRGI